MRIVRLYDGTREPQSWMQIIQPHQVAVFCTLADTGAACDVDGVPTSGDDASCAIFDALPAAEAFCRERVEQSPQLRFDILDSAGRRRLPLMTIVHPSRVESLDGSASKMRWNRNMAVLMLVAGPTLIWYDWTFRDGLMILPTIVGINLVLIGIRLLVMNRGHVAAERARRERVANATRDTP